MLVATVLAPHRAEHRPLQRVRLAANEIAHKGGLVFGEARVLWNLVRLRRFRRPQGWGRTHDREIAPCDAIRAKSSASTPRAGALTGRHCDRRDDRTRDDGRVLADAHEKGRLSLPQKVDPAEVEPWYGDASPILRDREAKVVEGVIGANPGAVIRTKTRCKDDRSESRQIDALGWGRSESAWRRQIRRCHAAALAGVPNAQAEIGVTRVAERDRFGEIVPEAEPRRVGADEAAQEVHAEPLQGAVVEVTAASVSGGLGIRSQARLRLREIAKGDVEELRL